MKFIICASILYAVGFASAAQSPSGSFILGTAADEAAIRAIVGSQSADKEDPHVAADLDWENAFGIRYTNLEKRNHFFNTYIKSQFKNTTNDSLEVKVRFLESTVAVADEYWHVAGQVYAGETKSGADRWGRTTYLFKKVNDVWIEVLERVADLRSSYFKHYDAIPAPVHVDSATLASYAGKYAVAQAPLVFVVTVSGDHLIIASQRGTFQGVPASATDFLGFDPNDLAEYYLVTFHSNAASAGTASTPTMTLSRADGQLLATAARVQ